MLYKDLKENKIYQKLLSTIKNEEIRKSVDELMGDTARMLDGVLTNIKQENAAERKED